MKPIDVLWADPPPARYHFSALLALDTEFFHSLVKYTNDDTLRIFEPPPKIDHNKARKYRENTQE